jgi:hypothetical protein
LPVWKAWNEMNIFKAAFRLIRLEHEKIFALLSAFFSSLPQTSFILALIYFSSLFIVISISLMY